MKATQHPLIEFFEKQYPDLNVKTANESRFLIPGFADALCSANFITDISTIPELPYFNIISKEEPKSIPGYTRNQTFYLGSHKLENHQASKNITGVVSLKDSISMAETWNILEAGFPNDMKILRKLLLFFAQRHKRAYTLFFAQKGKNLGMINLSLVDDLALVFNAAVLPDARRTGISHQMIQASMDFCANQKIREMIFWTKHSFLQKYAEKIHYYSIYNCNRKKTSDLEPQPNQINSK